MSQPIVINIGAIPNDGTGDPLRTAFNDVNINFANVWATGLVGSNVQIANNTILTTNTNGNLVLAPNGIAVVQSNVSIVPNTGNIRNLGSSAQRWGTVYSQYLNVAGLATIANVTISGGNITIPVADLHILGGTNGYVLQTDGTGNLTWTAQTGGGGGNGTPGGANTQVQFNDAGAFGGAAGFTFNNTTSELTVPGNITLSLTPSGPSNQIKYGMGNLVAWLDGQWTIGEYNGSNYGTEGIRISPGIEGNVEVILPSDSTANTNALQLNNYVGNVQVIANGNTWEFNNQGELTAPGNIITNGSGGDIITTGGNITGANIVNANAIVGNGNLYLQPDANNAGAFLDIYLTTGPDIHIAGNGENVIIGRDGASNVTVNTDGNVNIQSWNGSPNTWTFSNDGTLSLPYGNLVGLGNVIGPGNISYPFGPGPTLLADSSANNSAYFSLTAVANAEGVLGYVGIANFGGNASTGLVETVDGTGNVYDWYFQNDGTTAFPEYTFPNVDGASGQVFATYGNGTIYWANASSTGNIGFSGDAIYDINGIYLENADLSHAATAAVVLPANGDANAIQVNNTYGNIALQTGAGSGITASWSFDNTGNLNTPQGGYIGAAGIKGDGTMLTGGNGNITSLTSYYSSGMYSSCVTVNADGTLNITNYGDGSGITGQWQFTNAGNLILPPQNVSGPAGESQMLTGSRRIINGVYTGATNPYAVELPGDGSATVVYSTEADVYINSAKVTFAVQATGTGANWEQFDVVFTPDYVNAGQILWVVSNRIKANSTVADTIVTVAYGSSSQIQISLQLPVGQNGWASFDAVEFGLMVD